MLLIFFSEVFIRVFFYCIIGFFFCFVCAVFSFSFLLFLSVIYFYLFFGESPWDPAGAGWTTQYCWPDPALTLDLTAPVGQGCVNPAPDPWCPGQAGTLYPQGHSGYGETGTTGPPWVLGHGGYGGTVGTVPPPQGYSKLRHRQAGLPQYRSATAQLLPAHPSPPALGWGWTGLGSGSHYKHDLKGERWVSRGAGGRRKGRE